MCLQVALFVSVMVFLACERGMAAPKVKLDTGSFDAGVVPEGLDVTHEFVVTNVGDAPLVIKPRPC
jgi:hypothetical protein